MADLILLAAFVGPIVLILGYAAIHGIGVREAAAGDSLDELLEFDDVASADDDE